MTVVIDTYVAMQHHNDSVAIEQLGASPAELGGDVEESRQRSWHTHDGEAELRLWEDGE
jgi:hypothetical protein